MKKALFFSALAASLLCSQTALACTPGGCGVGQFCAVDSRITDGSSCFQTCALSTGSAGCPATDVCVSVTGQGVCVPPDSPLATGGGTSPLPSCASGRTCPADHTYACVSERCYLADGQPCTSDGQCLSTSTCAPAASGGTGTVCTPHSTPASGSSGSDEAPFTPITPQLGAPIPGVTLSPATKEGDYVQVPYLAEYINGAYRYLIGISLIAAIVMTVYGGFRYLVGASLGDVKSGKKIITDALGGMLIILAAYLILNTINPATLNLSILNIQYVSRIDLDTVLETTRVDTTAVSLDDNADGGAAGVGGGSCPVHLATAATDPPGGEDNRSDEFKTAIAAAVTGGSSRDRVVHMADAAASCGVALGSCGHTAEEIYTLAGSAARGFQTHTIPQSIIVEMGQHKCQTYSRECNRPAMAQMFELTHGQVSGWPEAFTNDLQPGDVITVFNANSDGYGLHRAIFMGWAGSGRARVVQGSWGRLVSSGTICLTTACSNPEPIVRTFQPRP